ncbi:MAG TPA: type II toxin-antitoxin system PemK/MazF family toxin [Aeromicrobium sp.]|nr:type II toxin-antitoxin system PemK/MazF family toxin [Aeromicrobium sp.]
MTEARQPRRGEVWLADVPGDKRRPVVVLTRDAVLPRLSTILVAPVTTRRRGIPTEVRLGAKHGLSRECVANFDNILPLPKRVLARRLGRLGRKELGESCAAARFAINC